jgi:polysaccharide export outer membrane protein
MPSELLAVRFAGTAAHAFRQGLLRWSGACLLALLIPSLASAGQADYVIGPDDVLTITVFGQPTMTGKYNVEADGTFTFPLLGRIVAGGQTLRGLEQALIDRLLDGYMKRPEVSVSIDQHRSKRIFLMGEVRQPGEYMLRGETSLLEALARAGSTTAEASGEVVVLRPPAGEAKGGPVLPEDTRASEVVRVSLEKLQAGELSQNMAVRDGDTIFLPRGEKVFVYGQVRAPGAYSMQKDMTVLQALSVAGGVTERGAANRVRVARFVNGERKEVDIKLGDRIRPGDTIIVPERFF